MNNVERLIELFGSQNELSRVIDRDPTVIIRAKRADGGRVPVRWNRAIKDETTACHGRTPEWQRAVLECLENPVCPTCGQPIDEGFVV